jgi:hypothetical protein
MVLTFTSGLILLSRLNASSPFMIGIVMSSSARRRAAPGRHADPRTTRLYDRRQKKITRNIVERISI